AAVALHAVVIEARLDPLDRPHERVDLDRVQRPARRARLLQDDDLLSEAGRAVAAPDVAENGRELFGGDERVPVEAPPGLAGEQQLVERASSLGGRQRDGPADAVELVRGRTEALDERRRTARQALRPLPGRR